MAWFGEGLSSLRGQLSNLAKGVLVEEEEAERKNEGKDILLEKKIICKMNAIFDIKFVVNIFKKYSYIVFLLESNVDSAPATMSDAQTVSVWCFVFNLINQIFQ